MKPSSRRPSVVVAIVNHEYTQPNKSAMKVLSACSETFPTCATPSNFAISAGNFAFARFVAARISGRRPVTVDSCVSLRSALRRFCSRQIGPRQFSFREVAF
jgi:hypothetical protein